MNRATLLADSFKNKNSRTNTSKKQKREKRVKNTLADYVADQQTNPTDIPKGRGPKNGGRGYLLGVHENKTFSPISN